MYLLAGASERKRIQEANKRNIEVFTTLEDLLTRLKEPEETRHEPRNLPAPSRNSRSADDISGTNNDADDVEVSREEGNNEDIGEQDEAEHEQDGYCETCIHNWDEPANHYGCFAEGCKGNKSRNVYRPPPLKLR